MNDLESIKDKLAQPISAFYVSNADAPLIDAIKEHGYASRPPLSFSHLVMEALRQVYGELVAKEEKEEDQL